MRPVVWRVQYHEWHSIWLSKTCSRWEIPSCIYTLFVFSPCSHAVSLEASAASCSISWSFCSFLQGTKQYCIVFKNAEERISLHSPTCWTVLADPGRLCKTTLSACNCWKMASRLGDSLMSFLISCVVSRADFINLEFLIESLAARFSEWLYKNSKQSSYMAWVNKPPSQISLIFPNFFFLFELWSTISFVSSQFNLFLATNATSEQSFSILRRVKTHLRNTMSQQRMNN